MGAGVPVAYFDKETVMETVDNKAGETAVQRAKREFAEEKMKESVRKLKAKFKELDSAETVVANIRREIADLEEAISQGNA